MPFEVYPIAAAREGARIGNRSIEEVVEKVKATYEKVAAKGGSIIGSHTVDIEHAPTYSGMSTTDRAFTGAQYLLLVAEFPPALDILAEVEE